MRSLSAGVAVAVCAFGCTSAGGPKPRGPGAPLPDALQSWVGAKCFLARAGEAKTIALKGGEPLPKGDCDVAVEVRSVAFDAGTVALSLDTLGRAEVEGRMRGRDCREVPAERRLTVAGLSAAEDAPAALEKLLTTPEAHLAARDVSFDLAPGKALPKLAAVSAAAGGTSEERSLGRQLTSWPKAILVVHPRISGHVRHEGEIEFALTVGDDGRAYKPTLLTSLPPGQEERVLEIFALWRYEPARKGDARVAARIQGRATLRVE